MGLTLLYQHPQQPDEDEAGLAVVADDASAAVMADDLGRRGFVVIKIAGSQFSGALDQLPFLWGQLPPRTLVTANLIEMPPLLTAVQHRAGHR